ncbi:unnamed protein product [Parnassius apollo]|uniref:(apollo) hypothetical protein n=1 Tax=Parnassius apollo TaxID=110799 RepID=A0A8S3XVD6_PARAO|nr:unnamed protein product [Parnassius apollo]
MKRVRFETPTRSLQQVTMNDFDCQSPRPFIDKKLITTPPVIKCDNTKVLQFSNDPLQKYECANGSPYPIINKTCLELEESKWLPSNELEISLLDSCKQMSKNIGYSESDQPKGLKTTKEESRINCYDAKTNSRVLSSLENISPNPPNVLSKHDFFLQRQNIHKISEQSVPSLSNQFKDISLDKENNPLVAKTELMKLGIPKPLLTSSDDVNVGKCLDSTVSNYCMCHHCLRGTVNSMSCNVKSADTEKISSKPNVMPVYRNHTCLSQHLSNNCNHCECYVPICKSIYNKCLCDADHMSVNYKNTVDKKNWALEKYEQSKGSDTLDIEKQGNTKEKREPTVSDLFKIIKLQNEQLQLLQEKVDKFISGGKLEMQKHSLTQHVAVDTVDKEDHKISIGVMTSFEMVRTSTIINKEIMKQCNEAQIQCNRSQISIREVLQPVNSNFLDGITPAKNNSIEVNRNSSVNENNILPQVIENWQKENAYEDKTFNEQSLYNVQVDNATTPLMSPEQSMYLDVRDYSDSDSEYEDQSNVGWTYYNKVMTHVNGMLHDSDMPSSASALYRNTRQKCMQMKIDKTNVSVIKRVKFGDQHIGTTPQHIMAASTDTSLKMNQLAAKYLKNGSLAAHRASPKPTSTAAPVDMSFATRKYMEKHQLLQGLTAKSKPEPMFEIPRFLDITTLKQQPKLL